MTNMANTDLVKIPGMAEIPGVSKSFDLAALQKEGVTLAVASNKYQAATERLVGIYFPEVDFA